MKLFIASCFCLLTLCLSGQIHQTRYHQDQNGYSYEKVTHDPVGLRMYTLQNGLTVYLARNLEEPRILYINAVRAGSKYDSPEHTGLAHYLEHLLFNGTDKIGSLDWEKEKPLLEKIKASYEEHRKEPDPGRKKLIYKKIDSLSFEASKYSRSGEYRKIITQLGGVATNGVTNVESVMYGTYFASNNLEKLLLVEKERFSNPSFRAFHTELEIVFEEFNSIQDNDFFQKYLTTNKLLFPTHPYGQQTNIGDPAHLKNPSIAAIEDYFHTYYVPNNMAVILVGDLEFDKTIQWVDKTFGTLKPRSLENKKFPKEKLIAQPITAEITNPHPESLYLAFRGEGVGSEDAVYLSLIGRMLGNPMAGMLELELKDKQELRDARSINFFINKDYSAHYLEGFPNTGQSLEEVKKALLSVLTKIKMGEFEEWLIEACANDLKRSFIKNITEYRNLDAECAKVFTQFRKWEEQLQFYEDLRKVTKEQLMKFAQNFYRDNYVVLYKRQGEAKDLVKVENPGITPIHLNEDAESDFARQIEAIHTKPQNPEFVNYSEEQHHFKLDNQVPVIHIENKSNPLFQLEIIFDWGRDQDRNISYAANYIPYLGTTNYSAEELKKEFYKLGLSFSVRAQYTRTVFSLEGLPENLTEGIRLLDDIFRDLQADTAAFSRYVQNILESRKSSRSNKRSILTALSYYAMYGEKSSFTNIYSEEELRNTDPTALVNLIKDLRNYKHRIFYYGSDLPFALKALNENYISPAPTRAVIADRKFIEIPTKREVYFVHFEGAQAEVMLSCRGEKFSRQGMIYSNMFNRFFEKLTFQQIREARSLAYNSWTVYYTAGDTAQYNYLEMAAGTQTNKLAETLDVMTGLMEDISDYAAFFDEAKADQIKRYQGERIIGTNIFWSSENYRRLGIGHDFRKDMYEGIQKMSFADLARFFEDNVGNRNAAILVVGDKNEIDLNMLAKYGEVKELDVKFIFNNHSK